MSVPVPQAEPRWPVPSRPLPLRSLSTSHTECLHQQSVSPHRLRKLACACHSHNGSKINTFVPILAALPLCPPAPKNRTACKTQPLCQLITALLLQSFAAPVIWLRERRAARGFYPRGQQAVHNLSGSAATPPARWIRGRPAVPFAAAKMRSHAAVGGGGREGLG